HRGRGGVAGQAGAGAGRENRDRGQTDGLRLRGDALRAAYLGPGSAGRAAAEDDAAALAVRGGGSRRRGERVHLGGHDEVVLVQPLDLVRVEDDAAVAPAEADVGVMALRLGDRGDLLDQGQGGGEVGRLEGALDARRIGIEGPARRLAEATLRLGAGDRRDPGPGGGEVDPATMIRTIEIIAAADGAAGWSAMIGATSGVASAYLADDAAREIYGSEPEVVSGGAFAPLGRATVVDGGYRVTGRWPFASGCEHCAWLMGGSVVLDGGQPRLLPSGMPDNRLMLFPAAQVRII